MALEVLALKGAVFCHKWALLVGQVRLSLACRVKLSGEELKLYAR